MSLEVTEVGPTVEAVQHHHAKIEQKPGEHLWICVAMYRVRPEQSKHYLDTENLLTIEGPGCYWCEQEWKTGLEKTPCRGEPKRT